MPMSWVSSVFVSTNQIEPVIDLLEGSFQGAFTHQDGGDPYIDLGRATVSLGSHEVTDGTLIREDGTVLPLAGTYPLRVEIRSTDRQLAIQRLAAYTTYDTLKAVNLWKLVHVEDREHVVESHEPPAGLMSCAHTEAGAP